MNSNFNFLNPTFPDLAKLGHLAERNLYDDPQTTMGKLRLMCEFIVSDICQIESVNIKSDRQVDRLNELDKEGIMPLRVKEHFHSIRISGNKAVHNNQGNEAEALLRLKQARNICVWYYQTYADQLDFMPGDFTKPLSQKSLQDTTKLLESEIEKLRLENEQLLIDKQKAILAESQAEKANRRERAIKSSDKLDISEEEARLIVDEALKKNGWAIIRYNKQLDPSSLINHAVEEYPTETGPVDYAFFVEGKLLGMLEAKRPAVNPRNVLDQQTKRYAKSAMNGVGNWKGYKVPFLYASNSEQIFHLDVRNSTNTDREIFGYHSPAALKEKFERDEASAEEWLVKKKIQHPWIRDYQERAIKAIEDNIIRGKYKMMLAMATGTGKTFTAANIIYRLLKSKKAKRILFLVDRKSLASQTVRSFSSFDTPRGNKLHKEYEIYSQKFQKKEFEEDGFDNEILPNEYLTDPDESITFVYVATIQRMSINLFGKAGKFSNSNDFDKEEDENAINIPIHAFDVIIADECHRGYTSKETNLWRSVLNHFDAIKIGLTATPAAHTVAFFGMPVYEYPFEQAVLDGYLCDYDPIPIHSNVKINGAFLKEGELVGQIDTKSGKEQMHNLEAEREYNSSDIEVKITVPDTNRKILLELKKHCEEFEKEHSRFPKTLIFAVNDINHRSHADELVNMAKEIFGRGNDFVKKITGNKNVDRPLQRIKEFRNRQEPKMVVTVDMLSTGVDIPPLEFIVFLRPVKSRILWEQMLGRGTRKADDFNIDKDRFYVFDCFGGDLFRYFKNASKMSEKIKPDTVPLKEVIERIFRNEEREYNQKRLIKRLRRIEKSMSGEAYEQFEPFITNGNIGKFADELPNKIKNDFITTMKLLRNEQFQYLLQNYKRPKKSFVKAYEVQDEVHSERLFKVNDLADLLKPEDYLSQFRTYIETNQQEVEALKIILERPGAWNTSALKELRSNLATNGYPVTQLRDAHKLIYDKELVDVISMVKHAVSEEEPLLSIEERVIRGVNRIFIDMELTEEQEKWVEYIKQHLIENLTIEEDDFRDMPVFTSHGGWRKFKKLFGQDCKTIVKELNRAIAI
ncbi:DEAD/DEAH box helicase [Marinilabiliaceae bacterium JC017]|nr:DEAD/DEAH box helicase [Marinilabiliaceae bacterium JC017]